MEHGMSNQRLSDILSEVKDNWTAEMRRIAASQHAAVSGPRESAASETTPQRSNQPSWAWRPLHGPNPYGDKPVKPRISLSFGGWCCSDGVITRYGYSACNAYDRWAASQDHREHVAHTQRVIFAHV